MRVVILGGGVTGLSAAYSLLRDARGPLQVTVVEKEGRWGGKIRTERVELDGAGPFWLEMGPDSLLTRKPAGVALCRELGLGDQLVGTDPARSGAFVRLQGRLQPLPPGLSQLVPTRWAPFLFSPLISPAGKLRMALDLFIPPRADEADESLGAFVRRRLGREALERIAEPLLAGIHAADPDQLSLRMAFPQFRELERQHGSLVRAVLRQRRQGSGHGPAPSRGSGTSSGHGPGRPGGAGSGPSSLFVSLRGGLGRLAQALVEACQARGAQLLAGTAAVALRERPADSPRYEVVLADGRVLPADAVLLCLPAAEAARLLAPLVPEASRLLATLPAVSVAGAVLIYRQEQVPPLPPGTGYVVPRSEATPVTAVTWVKAKWPHMAPDGYQVFRCHFGRGGREEAAHWDDAQLIQAARQELATTLGLRAEPLYAVAYRWPGGMPQFPVGHLERMAQVRQALSARPGLYVAGAPYGGGGIPDCVRQGQEVAAQLLAQAGQEKLPERRSSNPAGGPRPVHGPGSDRTPSKGAHGVGSR